MKNKRRVILYGRSVILGTLGASLSCYPELEIVHSTVPLPQFAELKALAPDVIIYDIESATPAPALALLESIPGLQLIGLNPDTNQVQVWSGTHLHELSTRDLVKVITQAGADTDRSEGAVDE